MIDISVKCNNYCKLGFEPRRSFVIKSIIIIHFQLKLFSGKIQELVLGMPHRGRLNLLTGLLEYPAAQLFHKV